MQVIIGIDPGQAGALAALEKGVVVQLEDMPLMGRLHGKGQEVDASALSSIIMEMRMGNPCVVFIEQVSSRPGESPVASFHFGESFGIIKGVCGALQLPVRFIRPNFWKKNAGLIGKEKDVARTLAIQQHPEVSDMLKRKKDIGRADAICIAEYGGKYE